MTIGKLIKLALVALAITLSAPSAIFADSIAVTVNEAPITSNQISMRARLLKLERRGSSDGARNTMARAELIDEALKTQDAERLGVNVSEAQVDDAFLNIARNMRISSDGLNSALQQGGVSPTTVRDRLRVQLMWNQISQNVISANVQFSELELEQRAADSLSDADSVDYILKEVRFIIPQGSNVSQSRRTAEANQYRQSFQGCDTAVELSMSYTDAAVIDVGRRHATQLPDQIAAELATLNEGGITKPRVAENGITMIAICSKTVARDLTFVTSEVRQEIGSEMLEAAAETYLQNLRDTAAINNR